MNTDFMMLRVMTGLTVFLVRMSSRTVTNAHTLPGEVDVRHRDTLARVVKKVKYILLKNS